MNQETITIDSFDDVMKLNGTEKRKDFSHEEDEAERKHLTAKWEWEQIVKAYNKKRDPEFVADPGNHDQDRYFPWVSIVKDSSQPSGFAFSNTSFNFTLTNTYVGSRQVFADPDDVIEALEKFGQTFIQFIIS